MKLIIAIIFIICFAFLGYFFYIGLDPKDIGLNFIIEIIGALITVFVIQKILTNREAKKWKEAESVMNQELGLLTNKLRSHFREPMNISIKGHKFNIDNKNEIEELQAKLFNDLIQNLDLCIEKMTEKNWKSLELNLTILKQDLYEAVIIYQNLLPGQIFGKLLRIKSLFNIFYEQFGIAPFLFTASKDHWSTNIFGEEQSKIIRMSLEASFKKDLKVLFNEIKGFGKLIK